MAKKSNTAAAKKMALPPVTIIEPVWTLSDDGKSMSLDAGFIKRIKTTATEIGTAIRGWEQKMQDALNVASAFAEYKRLTTNGFPAFVNAYFDSSLPKSYGGPKSDERKKLVASPLFNGLDYLNRKGAKEIQKITDRNNLIKAGINPEDSEKVGDHNKNAKQDKAAKLQDKYNRSVLGFVRFGVTQTTVENFVVLALGKASKKGEITAAGQKVANEIMAAVNKFKGGVKTESEPENEKE